MTPSLASLGYPCPNPVHATPPKVFPYLVREASARYLCLDCDYGWPIYGPVTPEQARENAAVLHREVGAWQVAKAAASRALESVPAMTANITEEGSTDA